MVSVLLSALVEGFSVTRRWDFVLKISIVSKNVSYLLFSHIFLIVRSSKYPKTFRISPNLALSQNHPNLPCLPYYLNLLNRPFQNLTNLQKKKIQIFQITPINMFSKYLTPPPHFFYFLFFYFLKLLFFPFFKLVDTTKIQKKFRTG